MDTREELYKKTGYIILEVLGLIVKDEINILRAEHGLPERTDQQLKTAIENKLRETDWDFFEEEEE